MKKLKFLQYLTGLLVILSLFASSVIACDCAHHQEKLETKISSSCHDESSAHSDNHQNNEKSKDSTNIVCESVCVCVASPPQASVKSEILKIEKQIAVIPVIIKAASFFQLSPQIVKISFEKSDFLTDSFYSLTPGRAPPTRL